MINTRKLIGLSLVALSTAASAGAFDGPSLQVGVDFNNAQSKLSNYSPDGTVSNSQSQANLAFNYSQAYGKFNLGFSAFSILGDAKSGSLRSTSEDTGGDWWDSFKLKNIWGVSIEPGVNVNDSVLAYLKFSAVRAKGVNTYDYTGATAGDTSAGSASVNHNGTGFGAGVKFKLGKDVYGAVEVEQIRFNNKVYYGDASESYKPSMLRSGVSIGFLF